MWILQHEKSVRKNRWDKKKMREMREKRGKEERKKSAATSENGRKDMTFDQIILWVMAAGVIIGAADKIFGNRKRRI